MCCFSQLSLLSSELAMAIRIDPFSLFPREVSLRVLGYLDAISLGRAAQVSRLWRSLADNDLLWRNMCEQHIERKCEKCGWGLPRLRESRGQPVERALPPTTPDEEFREAAAAVTDGNLRRSVTAAANAAAHERRSRERSSPMPTQACKRARIDGTAATRPWKAVYCERLAIERNWRHGRYMVRQLRGHTDGIMCLAFREKNSQLPYPVLMTGSYDRTIRVWNLATCETLRVLTGHARGVRCLQFDDVKLITGSMDRTLKIWNWRTGELLRTLEGHTGGIVSMTFNEDMLVSGSADSSIRVWNCRTGECFALLGHRDWVNSVHLWRSRETQCDFLFSASDDGTIRLWDLQHRECIWVYRGHVGQVQSLKLVTMDHATVRKLSRGTVQVGQDVGESESAPHFASRPGCPSVGSSDSLLLDQLALMASAHHDRPLHPDLALVQKRLSDAHLIPALPADATMNDVIDDVFDTGADSSESPPPSCGKKPRPVLVSGSLDNTLKLWDVRTGECFRTLFGHVEGVWCVDVDKLRIVSSSHDRTVKVWDRDTAQCQNTLVGHRAAVTSVALGDDKIVSGSDDGAVRVWSFCPVKDETPPAAPASDGSGTPSPHGDASQPHSAAATAGGAAPRS